jgi:hypothetical protein
MAIDEHDTIHAGTSKLEGHRKTDRSCADHHYPGAANILRCERAR